MFMKYGCYFEVNIKSVKMMKTNMNQIYIYICNEQTVYEAKHIFFVICYAYFYLIIKLSCKSTLMCCLILCAVVCQK